MQIKKTIIGAVIGAMILIPSVVSAQSSSINTFSPYTFYGMGDLQLQGTSHLRAMGGTGVAYRDAVYGRTLFVPTFSINNLNPASYSGVIPHSFIFNFELEGGGFYLKDRNTKSSYNSFNVRDVSILFPLARKLGFSFSLNPYSSVGYRLEHHIDDKEIVGNVGDVRKYYEGSGDISQAKVGIGYELFRNFSVGIDMIYYFGSIDRTQAIGFTVISDESGYTSTSASLSEEVSRLSLNAGFQWNVISKPERVLTVGGTYRMGGKLNSKSTQYIPANDIYGDTVYFANRTSNFSMADVYTVGLFYHNRKMGAGLDYSYANWGEKNKDMSRAMLAGGKMEYVNTHTFKAGLQFTPNIADIRNYLKRITYRVGFRYGDEYMKYNGKKITDQAITAGFGLPFQKTIPSSTINVGMEYGWKGTTSSNLVRMDYFRFSIGLNFIGQNWFVKQRYY